jgi:hypothetical protein
MVMKRYAQLIICLLLVSANAMADGIEDIRRSLELSAPAQVQEKVYIHTDNECYFVGDTLWYKAYVVRADNLHPTDMSRILYVELLTPDGLLVERQNIIVSSQGHSCGQFVLHDSLYSGYYELRAYTRWMLNFNVRQQRYSTHDTWHFYNKQMAADFFRAWDGLYSRVLPVYSKPEAPGDYSIQRMYQRPKTRLPQRKKDQLLVNFYPEGGHLVKGVENRVAFEAVDQLGEAVNIRGTVEDGGQRTEIKTDYMGRGSFMLTPTGSRLKAHFSFRGKDYTADLPKAEEQGIAIRLEDGRLTIRSRQLQQSQEWGLSLMSGGVLRYFTRTDGSAAVSLPMDSLPTGVAELTVFDGKGRIWADRLFFVNHHEHDGHLITSDISPTRTYAPYERAEVTVQLGKVAEPTLFSLSIHDRNTDAPTYDDGNLMTSMLLSSELRGFIAHPAYYFEKDDEEHRMALDLLMMTQGWRRFNWQEMAVKGAFELRHPAEQTQILAGQGMPYYAVI